MGRTTGSIEELEGRLDTQWLHGMPKIEGK
jgi:hypothetical protein